jgi:signal transduction histidine kinase
MELRPAALDDLGLVDAVHAYVDEWADRFAVRADFDATGVGVALPTSPVDTKLYRIVQEALNNVAKHARARHVSVTLAVVQGWINLVVEDDGVGFDPQQASDRPSSSALGLVGMRERIALADGTLIIESAPGKGTSVLAHVPISPIRL